MHSVQPPIQTILTGHSYTSTYNGLIMYHYQVFGLHLEADLIIPELLSYSDDSHVEIVIKRGIVPYSLHSQVCETIQGNNDQLLITTKNIGRFIIESGKYITYQTYHNTSTSDLRLFLLGSCIGALLQQRNYIVLHGCAVSVNAEQSIIFIGTKGAGKSTMAAYYAQQKAAVLTDDICLITFDSAGIPYLVPSYPQIKLWQNSADLLGISTRKLRRFYGQNGKLGLPVNHLFVQKPFSITHIYEIVAEKHAATRITGHTKLTKLIDHSYRYHFITKMSRAFNYVKSLMYLANTVNISTTHRISLDSCPR